MKIPITDSDGMNRLLDTLADEIVNAHVYHRLFRNLVDSIPQYEDDLNQSPVFWNYTLSSLRDSRLVRVCRIYDQQSNSLNLFNLLQTIEANLHLFSEAEFRKRRSDSPHVDSLAAYPRQPDEKELKADLDYSSDRNPVVKKLLVWRNNIVAHRGAKVSLGRKDILDNNPISKAELEDLLDRALKIFNHYSHLFRASTWSVQIIGEADYQHCLKMLHKGIEATKAEHQAEIARLHGGRNGGRIGSPGTDPVDQIP
jgi:hypothetical protein